MKDGKGSPIIFVPILILLLVAGGAALLGAYLGAEDDDTTVSAPLIPNPVLGPPCGELLGPVPTNPVDARVWRQAAVSCIENRITGTVYDDQGVEQGTKPVSGAEGFVGVTVEGFAGDVLVVRWAGVVPQVVVDRVEPLPDGVVVAWAPTR
jgi:hypothetical protein